MLNNCSIKALLYIIPQCSDEPILYNICMFVCVCLCLFLDESFMASMDSASLDSSSISETSPEKQSTPLKRNSNSEGKNHQFTRFG